MPPSSRNLLLKLGLPIALALIGVLFLADRFDLPSRWTEPLRSVPIEEGQRAFPLRPLSERDYVRPPGSSSSLIDGSLRAEPSTAAARAVIYLDGERRRGVAGGVPYKVQTTVTIPDQAELWFGINGHGSTLDAPGTRFHIRLTHAGVEEVVFEAERAPYLTGWNNHRLNLVRWAGKEVELVLEAMPAAAGHAGAVGRAFWADLRLRSASAVRDRPNVVVLLLDTLRPDHLGCYGYSRPTSPVIDSLAADGVLFRNAFSVAPWTDPSIAGLFTSLYPSDIWQPAEHRKIIRRLLPEGVATLAETLGAAGYFSIAASDHPGINRTRFGAGFDVFAMLHDVTEEAKAWNKTPPFELLMRLDEILDARPADRGMFVYLHLIYPHIPYVPSERYREIFGDAEYRIAEDNREGLIDLYDAEIRLTDDVVGSILSSRSQTLFANETIVVLLSDHGEGFWEHGLFEHGNSLFNELLRIPLILHAPGRVPAGSTVDELVRIIDVAPTIVDLLKLEPPRSWRGESMLPLLDGSAERARLAYSEFPHTEDFNAHAVQSLDEKAILPHDPSAEPRLFDLARDAEEIAPLPATRGSAGHAELIRWMRQLRETFEANREGLSSNSELPSAETIERLRSLGYVK